MSIKKWLVAGATFLVAAGCGSLPLQPTPATRDGLGIQNVFVDPYGGFPYGYGHPGPFYPPGRFIRDRDGFGRDCRFINPTYDPARVVEENEVAFRLRGEATWRPKCVSRPGIAEENEEAYRPIGQDIWRPRYGFHGGWGY